LVISIYVIRKTKSWGYIGIADDAS
jgi:hypothetical protein